MKICEYNVKNGCFPQGIVGSATPHSDGLWIFSPLNDDHKVVIETEFLIFL